jgi:OmcA/MtrC family decaheme c-type cytochrome
MWNALIRRGKGAVVAALAVLLTACGGGGGGGTSTSSQAPGPLSLKDALSAAATVPANDTSSNPTAAFSVLQLAGQPVVTVNSPPKVNFAVFSDGKLVTNLALSNASFAIAKLVPGTNGDPDKWVNYVYRTETATPTVGPNGQAVLASAKQATTDPKQTDPALAAQQLVLNEAGYYTYTFRTDIKDATKTNNVVFEPNLTHRVAIQLSFVNAAGVTVRVNPYFDFRFNDKGEAVALTDPATQTRKMTDVNSCNSCHEKLAMHGGGRVDTQFCVMCHNPGTTDANSGNVLTLSNMVHKIHAGKLLAKGGEDFTIWGFNNTKVSFAEVGFPQDLRNCSKCHSAQNASTPQGDNWKTKPSKEACLSCHSPKTGGAWESRHTVFAGTVVSGTATAADLSNAMCANCHKVGSNISPERVHWNQNEENGARYKMNIESAVYDAATRKVTIKYFLSDPTNGNKAYDLAADCALNASGAPACTNTNQFGNLRLIVGYQSLANQPTATTEFSSYNNGGNTAAAFAYTGTKDAGNHYTVQVTIPPDTDTHKAAGTARVVSIGQIKEPKLQVKFATDPRPEVTPRELVNVVVQNTFLEFPISGPLNPRRTIVATEKCNVCHAALGTTSGANTLSEAFHGGARNIVQACPICHDANRMSSTIMTNGLAFNESYQMKRMIHGIHGNSKRTYPFTHGNAVVDSFAKDGTSLTGGLPLAANVENYAAEVAWPGVGINCNVCHVDNSYKVDRGPLAAVIKKPPLAADPTKAETDPMKWLVISPKAASCTACHDSPKALGHVTSMGSAIWGNKTQGDSWNNQELCADCHSSGGFKGVDIVHGQQ